MPMSFNYSQSKVSNTYAFKGPSGDNSQDDVCYGFAVDSNDNIYCAGHTESNFGEINSAGKDSFVMNTLTRFIKLRNK